MPSLKTSFLAGLIVGAGFGLMLLILILSMWSRPHRKGPAARMRPLAIMGSLVGTVLIAWMIFRVGPLMRSSMRSPLVLLGLSVIVAGAMLSLTLLRSGNLDTSGRKVLYGCAFGVFLLGAIAGSWMGYVRSVPGRNRDAMILERPPFSGSWRVVWGGRSKATNYYLRQDDTEVQHRYAVLMLGERDANHSEYIYTAYAPFNGTIIAPSEVGHVVNDAVALRNERGQILLLRNIMPKTIRHQAGETVKTGDIIGEYGTYHWGSRPGLRMHAEKDGEPLAILIGPEKAFPIRGDIIEP